MVTRIGWMEGGLGRSVLSSEASSAVTSDHGRLEAADHHVVHVIIIILEDTGVASNYQPISNCQQATLITSACHDVVQLPRLPIVVIQSCTRVHTTRTTNTICICTVLLMMFRLSYNGYGWKSTPAHKKSIHHSLQTFTYPTQSPIRYKTSAHRRIKKSQRVVIPLTPC